MSEFFSPTTIKGWKFIACTFNGKAVNRFRAGDEIIKHFSFVFPSKSKDGENPVGATSRSTTPTASREPKAKKQVSIDAKESKKERRGKHAADKKEEKKFPPKKFSRKSKLRRKRKRHDPLYFGPLIECKWVPRGVAREVLLLFLNNSTWLQLSRFPFHFYVREERFRQFLTSNLSNQLVNFTSVYKFSQNVPGRCWFQVAFKCL